VLRKRKGKDSAKGPDKGAAEDLDSNPGTAAFVPDFDTGEDSVAFVPDFDDTGSQPIPPVHAEPEKPHLAEPEAPSPSTSEQEPENIDTAAPVQSVTVPGRYHSVKWWQLILAIFGVWLAAAPVGISLFYWWYHSVDKTPPVFMVLVYVVACTVAGVTLAMAESKPVISALAVGVVSAPFASVMAATPLLGYYHCAHVSHCLVGVIPY
jgi:hypothetical protein